MQNYKFFSYTLAASELTSTLYKLNSSLTKTLIFGNVTFVIFFLELHKFIRELSLVTYFFALDNWTLFPSQQNIDSLASVCYVRSCWCLDANISKGLTSRCAFIACYFNPFHSLLF